jgi:membrane protein YdbS with pleckstrin-like domain
VSVRTEKAAEWVYQGIWGILAKWFRVPEESPTLPAAPGESVRSFKPAPQFLAYRKFIFWFWLTIIDVAIMGAWLILVIAAPLAGALAVAVLPDIFAYIAIHLRYDTTWYVLSERSMRLRRGIWVIHETTITYENIQNVAVIQGPLQRYYGIATMHVKTAGGAAAHGAEHGGMMGAHVGVIEGITDAGALRDQIMARVEELRSAGLGDEGRSEHANGRGLGPAHVEALREIRDLISR